jgi:hypothetical protein
VEWATDFRVDLQFSPLSCEIKPYDTMVESWASVVEGSHDGKGAFSVRVLSYDLTGTFDAETAQGSGTGAPDGSGITYEWQMDFSLKRKP